MVEKKQDKPIKKSGNRRKGREMALQMLYLVDNCAMEPLDSMKTVLSADEHNQSIRFFAQELFEGISSSKEKLDELIIKRAKNWNLERMALIDRNILRLAAYEMVYMHGTPVNVIIDEAVEIAKSFSTSESGKFVNGILDKLKQERHNIAQIQITQKHVNHSIQANQKQEEQK